MRSFDRAAIIGSRDIRDLSYRDFVFPIFLFFRPPSFIYEMIGPILARSRFGQVTVRVRPVSQDSDQAKKLFLPDRNKN